MKNRIFLWGEATRFANYQRALEAGGAQAVLSTNPEDAVDCQGLLLTGGGDLDPALYGQENLCCQGVEPDRDEAEMELLDRFTITGNPILGICRGLLPVSRTAPDARSLADRLWSPLSAENKVVLFVRYADFATGAADDVIINRLN